MIFAILCGGHGTRAQQPINKCFMSIGNKPFILYLMEQVEAQGVSSTFVLCRGTGGTLTALREARDQLGEKFILLYGDTYLPLNFQDFIAKWEQSKSPSITATFDKIDAGVNGFFTHTLDMLDEDETDLRVLQAKLKKRMMTCHYPAPLRYMDIGTPTELALTKEMLGVA